MILASLFNQLYGPPVLLVNVDDDKKKVMDKIHTLLFARYGGSINLIRLNSINLIRLNDEYSWKSSYIKINKICKPDQHAHLSFFICKQLNQLENNEEGQWFADFDVDKELLIFNPKIEDSDIRLGADRIIDLLQAVYYKRSGSISTDLISVRHQTLEWRHRQFDDWYVIKRVENKVITIAVGMFAFNDDQYEWLETPLASNNSTQDKIYRESNQAAFATNRHTFDVNYNGCQLLINKTMAYSIPKTIEYIAQQQYKHTDPKGIHSQLIPFLSEKIKARLVAELAMRNLDPEEGRRYRGINTSKEGIPIREF